MEVMGATMLKKIRKAVTLTALKQPEPAFKDSLLLFLQASAGKKEVILEKFQQDVLMDGTEKQPYVSKNAEEDTTIGEEFVGKNVEKEERAAGQFVQQVLALQPGNGKQREAIFHHQ
jgi:hypothetical protein